MVNWGRLPPPLATPRQRRGSAKAGPWAGCRQRRHKSSVFMYKVYILESKIKIKYYVGHTDNVISRLSRHNKGYVKSTKAYRPWKLIHTEEYQTKQEAYKRELQIKSYKGGEAFKKLRVKS